MSRRDESVPSRLDRDLAELNLLEIARAYREVLDEAARKGSSMREVLGVLIGSEGPKGNVLKIRPPLPFGPPHAAMLLEALDQAL